VLSTQSPGAIICRRSGHMKRMTVGILCDAIEGKLIKEEKGETEISLRP